MLKICSGILFLTITASASFAQTTVPVRPVHATVSHPAVTSTTTTPPVPAGKNATAIPRDINKQKRKVSRVTAVKKTNAPAASAHN